MTQQPGQGWPQDDPYASGAQPPAYPQQPQGYPQPGYPQQGYPQPGYPQPGYPQQQPGYAGYAAGGYAPGYGQPLPALANWGKRVGAYLIDGIIASLPVLIAAVYSMATANTVGYDMDGRAVTEPTVAGGLALLVGYAWMLGVQIWNRWVQQGRTGQSIGKKALGIRLVSVQTMAPIGPGMAFVRDLCHFVDGIFYVGYLRPLWDAKKQTFADTILSTLVVEG